MNTKHPLQKCRKRRQRPRFMATYILVSGVERHRLNPHTFEIPPQPARESLRPGDHALLYFHFPDDPPDERMWVIVTGVTPEYYIGVLNNYPFTYGMWFGQKIHFHADHVLDIKRKEDKEKESQLVGEPTNGHNLKVLCNCCSRPRFSAAMSPAL